MKLILVRSAGAARTALQKSLPFDIFAVKIHGTHPGEVPAKKSVKSEFLEGPKLGVGGVPRESIPQLKTGDIREISGKGVGFTGSGVGGMLDKFLCSSHPSYCHLNIFWADSVAAPDSSQKSESRQLTCLWTNKKYQPCSNSTASVQYGSEATD